MLRGAADVRLLDLAATRLGHRGPDDKGLYAAGSVGLAHTRLSIIDLAGGHQPLRDDERGCAAIVNGEIYNFRELRAQLLRQGERFRTNSDSEVVLRAYLKFGIEGFKLLNGMFAAVIHDATAGELILVRDRLGIKPLYYCALPDRLAFASEIKALLTLLPTAPELRTEGLATFLGAGFCSGRDTILSAVQRLLPGEVIRVRSGLRVTRERYWEANAIGENFRSPQEAEEEFSALFRQVVREHSRADVPVGVFLSGGMDSTVVLDELTRLAGDPVHTFSLGYFGEHRRDELATAQQTASRYGTVHHEVRIPPNAVLDSLPLAMWAADDLVDDLAIVPSLHLAHAAATRVKVVLTGEGGDEVFAGYGRYRRTRLQKVLKGLRSDGGYRTRCAWPSLLRRMCFGDTLQAVANTWHDPFRDAWHSSPRQRSWLQHAQMTDIATELADRLLVKVDRSLMALGLEGRVPYLDHRVVEFGVSLPDRLKVHHRTGKVFLREWGRSRLSSEQLAGRKAGFFVPGKEALANGQAELIGQKLEMNRAVRRWFKPNAVPYLLAVHRKTGNAGVALYRLIELALWHTLLFDRPTYRPALTDNLLDVI